MKLLGLVLAASVLAVSAPTADAAVLVRFKSGTSAAARAETRREAGVQRERGLGVGGLETVSSGGDDRRVAAALDRDPAVLYAEPDQVRRAAGMSVRPSDPLFDVQWALRRISAPEAWATTTGSPGVTIAIADSGVAAMQPDVAPNLVPGRDFVDGDDTPEDETANWHGTQMAAVAGGRGDDGAGVAGVTWTSRIMPLRILDADGRGRVSDAIRAYEHAERAGARIVNLSLTGTEPSVAERDALEAARDVLFVAAAGNDGADVDAHPTYPCAYELANVLCVAASDRDDAPAPFSNLGARSVDLAAPGTAITGPLPSAAWGYASGTSFAAPHVAGAAALLLARVPAARPSDLAAALTGGADPVPALAGVTASGGRLDVAAALDSVRATPWPEPPIPQSPPAPLPPPAPAHAPIPAPPVVAPAAPKTTAPAKLKLRRAGTRHGRLVVLAEITRRARGSVEMAYTARGHALRLRVPIRNGRIRIDRRLPRALRSDDGGIVSLRWPGGGGVRSASLRLRAAERPAHLRRGRVLLRGGRLYVSGHISPRARGVVRFELVYGDDARVLLKARIRHGRWRLAGSVPEAARAGGYLSIQFTGDRRATGGAIRGEQDGIALTG